MPTYENYYMRALAIYSVWTFPFTVVWLCESRKEWSYNRLYSMNFTYYYIKTVLKVVVILETSVLPISWNINRIPGHRCSIRKHLFNSLLWRSKNYFVIIGRVGTKINFREIFAKIRTKIIFVFREKSPRKCENFAFRENGFLTKIRKFRFSRK